MIAEKMIREYYTTEPGSYLGEYNSKESAYKMADGCFVEGIDNTTYINYIKQYGLAKLMAKYWDQFLKEREIENSTQKQHLSKKPV